MDDRRIDLIGKVLLGATLLSMVAVVVVAFIDPRLSLGLMPIFSVFGLSTIVLPSLEKQPVERKRNEDENPDTAERSGDGQDGDTEDPVESQRQ